MFSIKEIIPGRLIRYNNDTSLILKIEVFENHKGHWLCSQQVKWGSSDIGFKYDFSEDYLKKNFKYIKQSKSHLPVWW